MSRVHVTGARSAGLLLTAAGVLAAGLVSLSGGGAAAAPRRPPPPRRSSTSSSSTSRTRGTTRRSARTRRRRTCRRPCATRASCSPSTSARPTTACRTTSRRSAGRAPTPQTQGDCQTYSDFVQAGTVAPAAGGRQRLRLPGEREDRRRPARGQGPDLARLHGGHGHAVPAPRRQRRRRHPEGEGRRPVRGPAQPVRLLPQHHRPPGLRGQRRRPDRSCRPTWPRPRRRANLTYITPEPVQRRARQPVRRRPARRPATADEWLRTWVPKILASPAYKKDGLLVRDLRRGRHRHPSGADACCGEGPGPNAPAARHQRPRRRPHRRRRWSRRS